MAGTGRGHDVKRRPDWSARLVAYVNERQIWPFEWGSNDCASFVAAGVEAITTADLGAWTGVYHDAEGAQAWLASLGCDTLAAVAEAVFDDGEILPRRMIRGDVLWLPQDSGLLEPSGEIGALLLAVGGGAVAVPSGQGLVRLSLLRAAAVPGCRAWAVGAR